MSDEMNQAPQMPDTSGWVRRVPGDVIDAGTPGLTRDPDCGDPVLVTSVEARVLVEGDEVWTPPPAPRPPWADISTDREKPTLAKVTYRDGREQTAKVYVEATSVRDEWHEAVAPVSYITNVTPLHTHDPETHVPVERALIDEAVQIAYSFDVDPAWPFGFVEKIAALADGAQS